jgi:outer membrane biosynthesis protein TonB
MTKMTKPLALLALVTALAACADANANSTQDELKRDLELASATTMKLVTPQVDSSLLTAMETKPVNVPAPAPVVKRAAGPRAIPSEQATVMAAPEPQVAAVEEPQVETETMTPAPAPENSEPVAVAPRPQPVIIQAGGAGDYGVGTGGMGGGDGGVVIRGGGVDGDNCRPRGRNGGPIVYRGPVYRPATVSPRGRTAVRR